MGKEIENKPMETNLSKRPVEENAIAGRGNAVKKSFKDELEREQGAKTPSYKVGDNATKVERFENIVIMFEAAINSINRTLGLVSEIDHSEVETRVGDLFSQINNDMGARDLLLQTMSELEMDEFITRYQRQILAILREVYEDELEIRNDEETEAREIERRGYENRINEAERERRQAERNARELADENAEYRQGLQKNEARLSQANQEAREANEEARRLRTVLDALKELQSVRFDPNALRSPATREILAGLSSARNVRIPEVVKSPRKKEESTLSVSLNYKAPKKPRKPSVRQMIAAAYEENKKPQEFLNTLSYDFILQNEQDLLAFALSKMGKNDYREFSRNLISLVEDLEHSKTLSR